MSADLLVFIEQALTSQERTSVAPLTQLNALARPLCHDADVTGANVSPMAALLEIEQLKPDVYEGRCQEGGPGRAYGGHVAAQALVAAGRSTDPMRWLHSAQVYFLRPARPDIPVRYEVTRLREGRSFVTLAVAGLQGEHRVCAVNASFQAPGEGFEHQSIELDAPGPLEAPSLAEWLVSHPASVGSALMQGLRQRPLEFRFLDEPAWVAGLDGERRPARQRLWMRTRGTLPDQHLLHCGALVYGADATLSPTAMLEHAFAGPDMWAAAVSLDLTIWFHRPFRADEWLYLQIDSPVAAGRRGLCLASVMSQAGELVATVAQESHYGASRPLASHGEHP
jgi:acyl-CoA thioesterase-2